MVQKLSVTILIICIYVIIYWKEIKLIKNKKVKDTLQILLGILFVPALILLLDIWNSFEVLIPNVYNSVTEKYDILSFLGAYLSAIVSSILLIIITDKDRKENTEILQNAQRPYLDVRYPKLLKKFVQENKDNNTIFFYRIDGTREEFQEEYLCLEIINNGESVAIIDINNMQIEIQYVDIEIGKDNEEIETKQTLKPEINTGLPRLSLGKGKSMYIIFLYEPFYKNGKINKASIIYSNIKYKDLFNKEYIDECKRSETGKQVVLQDNKEIGEE